MFNIFKRNTNYEDLSQKVTQLSDTISTLLIQNSKILEEQSRLRSLIKTDTLSDLLMQNSKIIEEQSKLRSLIETTASPVPEEKETNKNYTSYEKGTFNKPKENFFDSPAEKILEKYFNRICQKYNLGLNWGIRLLAHQPLINYVEMTNIKAVNNRNAFMHFDFLFEARNLKDYKTIDDKSGHFPLLAIELDGKFHNSDEQKERDSYKQGVCDKLKLHLIRIRYDEENFTLENIEAEYLKEIMTYLFVSIFDFTIVYKYIVKEKNIKLLNEKRDEIIQKYPSSQFPEVEQYINDAYEICLNQL